MNTFAPRLTTLSATQTQTGRTPLAIDKTFNLEINGSSQQIRMCAERTGLPPILIVQAGPGFPLLHEVGKFQKHLNLEKDFLVSYWDQRGCGNASKQDASSVSMQQQVDDVSAILRWLNHQTRQTIILFGISLGATFALQAAEQARHSVKAVITISADSHTAKSDASVASFLRAKSTLPENHRLSAKLKKLGEPPYVDPAALQLRARLLTDLGVIERGRKFGALLKEMLFGMIRTYGFLGTAKALRNMNLIQGKMLPELVSMNLFSNPPRLTMPAHYIFGKLDPLMTAELVKELPAAIASSESTVLMASDAGHMVHFDQPEMVRSIVMRASK